MHNLVPIFLLGFYEMGFLKKKNGALGGENFVIFGWSSLI